MLDRFALALLQPGLDAPVTLGAWPRHFAALYGLTVALPGAPHLP